MKTPGLLLEPLGSRSRSLLLKTEKWLGRRYCNQTRYIASLYEDLVWIAFPPPKVKVTMTENRINGFLTKTRVRNEILISNLVYSKLMWRPQFRLLLDPLGSRSLFLKMERKKLDDNISKGVIEIQLGI
jgi:hypothetical protein